MQLKYSYHYTRSFQVGGLYFSLNTFLPLLWLTSLLALDLAKGDLSESTLALLTSLVTVLGGSLIILLGGFLLLMNKEVRKRISKLPRINIFLHLFTLK